MGNWVLGGQGKATPRDMGKGALEHRECGDREGGRGIGARRTGKGPRVESSLASPLIPWLP